MSFMVKYTWCKLFFKQVHCENNYTTLDASFCSIFLSEKSSSNFSFALPLSVNLYINHLYFLFAFRYEKDNKTMTIFQLTPAEGNGNPLSLSSFTSFVNLKSYLLCNGGCQNIPVRQLPRIPKYITHGGNNFILATPMIL